MFVPLPVRFAAITLGLLTACGRPGERESESASSIPAAPPASAAPSEPEPGETSATWRTVTINAVPARVTLPDASRWHARRDGSFVVLEDRSSRAELVLRVWRAERLTRPSDCEATARLVRPKLPRFDPASILDRRVIDAPRGYDVRLVVGVDATGTGGVRGYAVAIGAAIGKCYVAAYQTWAEGPNAPERVASRLAVVVPGVIEKVEVPQADDRDVSSGMPESPR